MYILSEFLVPNSTIGTIRQKKKVHLLWNHPILQQQVQTGLRNIRKQW